MASSNPFSSDFRLVVCDGPKMPNAPSGYKVCNFASLMEQIQVFINVLIIVGVVATFISFLYAGYLYLTGSEGNIKKAKNIFSKVGIGFIIMLSAWFIVYQILNWLGADSSSTALLGNP